MEDTLLIGDHLLVDKLAYAPSGADSKHLLPYEDVKRGDIIVFRYPVEYQGYFREALHGRRPEIASGWSTRRCI